MVKHGLFITEFFKVVPVPPRTFLVIDWEATCNSEAVCMSAYPVCYSPGVISRIGRRHSGHACNSCFSNHLCRQPKCKTCPQGRLFGRIICSRDSACKWCRIEFLHFKIIPFIASRGCHSDMLSRQMIHNDDRLICSAVASKQRSLMYRAACRLWKISRMRARRDWKEKSRWRVTIGRSYATKQT